MWNDLSLMSTEAKIEESGSGHQLVGDRQILGYGVGLRALTYEVHIIINCSRVVAAGYHEVCQFLIREMFHPLS